MHDDKQHTESTMRPDGSIEVETRGRLEGSSAEMFSAGSTFTRVQTPTGTLEGLNDDTLVSGPSIPGDMMRLSQAVSAGYLMKNPDGTYSAPGDAPSVQQALEDSKSTQEGDEDEAFHPELQSEPIESEEVLGALVERVDGNDQTAAISQLIDTGELSEDLVGRVAGNLGLDPNTLQGGMGKIRADFEAQARTTIATTGIDPDAIIDWAHENEPALMRQAMMDQATKRTTSGYLDVAQEYLTRLDTIDPESILSAGFHDGIKAHQGGDGRIVLTLSNGSTVLWKDAVKTGLVSVR